MGNIEFHNMDCMAGMAKYPDKHFDLAITDPPYGLKRFERKNETHNRICGEAKINSWDRKPEEAYFKELFRVSRYQIIFGENNFKLPPSEYFIVWDKMQSVDNFASAEYMWTNIKMPAKVFRYPIHKIQGERKRFRKIHPCQKPIALYGWILAKYAKPGWRILDTHAGSASSLIACHDMNLDAVGFEIDKKYYELADERLSQHRSQMNIFDYIRGGADEHL